MRKLLLLCFVSLLVISCKEKSKSLSPKDDLTLIPIPSSVERQDFGFLMDAETKVVASSNEEVSNLLKTFQEQIKSASNLEVPMVSASKDNFNSIQFQLSEADSIVGEEGYALSVSHEGIVLSGNTPTGVYRGMQTLLQVMPDHILKRNDTLSTILVSGVHITDSPVYTYRGAMLDVARHFFEVEDVKRYIDLIASYKINTLHLHLADDQGWRIEIKSWPKLTEIGGQTEVGGGKGGFYTQEQYKEIVAYAAQQYITVIPEIDMPGHTNAALASYPELNCDGKATELYTGMKVGFSSLCVDKEITYRFVSDVIRELATLTPGDYIHIGGDESHATKPEDYKLFLNKIHPIVTKHGKKFMGWEDIQVADLPKGTIVQHWTDAKKAKAAALKGASIVLSPAPKTYLDMKYDAKTEIGLTWAGPTSVEDAYNWNPETLFPDVSRDKILGIESPLWSETVTTMDQIEYLAFPRIIGHAELGWSLKENRNWLSYKERMNRHTKRMNLLGIDYYKSPLLFSEN